jgi:hypothetical protein
MHPEISEFSYGYALTEELIRSNGYGLRAAPIFPSLIEEGKAGGGYDVKIPFDYGPLFLQFKLSHYMTKRAKEYDLFGHSFYRMHIRSGRYSNQHKLLLDLERSFHFVFYTAPRFHKLHELNQAYSKSQVIRDSVFIRPGAIGHLDDANHHVSFLLGRSAYLLSSNPQPIEAVDIATLAERLRSSPSRPQWWMNQEWLNSIYRELRSILEQNRVPFVQDFGPSLQDIAYIVRVYFGCEMFFVSLE